MYVCVYVCVFVCARALFQNYHDFSCLLVLRGFDGFGSVAVSGVRASGFVV